MKPKFLIDNHVNVKTDMIPWHFFYSNKLGRQNWFVPVNVFFKLPGNRASRTTRLTYKDKGCSLIETVLC